MAVQGRRASRRNDRPGDEGAAVAAASFYDRDFALWATEQAQMLKERRSVALDWENLAEETEALARNDRRAIRSYFRNGLLHMLKLAYWQAERERNGLLRRHLLNAREGIAEIIEDSPSLSNYPARIFEAAYAAARKRAVSEIGLSGLPQACPWTVDQLLDDSFWPASAN